MSKKSRSLGLVVGVRVCCVGAPHPNRGAKNSPLEARINESQQSLTECFGVITREGTAANGGWFELALDGDVEKRVYFRRGSIHKLKQAKQKKSKFSFNIQNNQQQNNTNNNNNNNININDNNNNNGIVIDVNQSNQLNQIHSPTNAAVIARTSHSPPAAAATVLSSTTSATTASYFNSTSPVISSPRSAPPVPTLGTIPQSFSSLPPLPCLVINSPPPPPQSFLITQATSIDSLYHLYPTHAISAPVGFLTMQQTPTSPLSAQSYNSINNNNSLIKNLNNTTPFSSPVITGIPAAGFHRRASTGSLDASMFPARHSAFHAVAPRAIRPSTLALSLGDSVDDSADPACKRMKMLNLANDLHAFIPVAQCI